MIKKIMLLGLLMMLSVSVVEAKGKSKKRIQYVENKFIKIIVPPARETFFVCIFLLLSGASYKFKILKIFV